MTGLPSVVHPRPRSGSPDVRRAWWCLAAFPVAFVAGFVGGEGIATLLGVDAGEVAPWWVAGLALLPILVLGGVPTALAWWFHGRARATGDPGARVPALVLTVLLAAVLAVNVLSWLLAVLVGPG